MSVCLAIAAVALWDTKKFSTYDISQILDVAEPDVERVIHVRRQAARGVA
jgi:hypothetical protein